MATTGSAFEIWHRMFKDVAAAVGHFLEVNIQWLKSALGKTGTPAWRERFAISAVASLQGAMMLSTTLKSSHPLKLTTDSLLAQIP